MRSLLIFLVLTLQATTASAEGTVKKENWMAGFKDILPAALCRDRGFFRSCFEISADECHMLLTDATQSCLRQYKDQIPQQLHQPKDGTEWGTKVGVCVGTIIEGSQAAKRIHNTKCDDPTAWKW